MEEPDRRRDACRVCAVRELGHRLCHDCAYRDAMARALYPSPTLDASDGAERPAFDDFEMWEAWALIGDPGNGRSRIHMR